MSASISSVTRNDGQANIFVHSTDVAEKDGILKAGDEVQPCFEKRTDFKTFSETKELYVQEGKKPCDICGLILKW